jgi:choline dehydrogenase-like flavoprotein
MPIFTGAQVREDRTIECDVCIVGSGAGGAVVAERLASRGKRVVVLEDGGFHTSDRFDMQERHMTPRLYQELGGRATADGSIMIVQGRAVGGTTVVNWTTCFRTPASVFEHWAEHHGVEGPTHDAIVPHWERIERRLNVTKMRLDQVNRNNRVTWDGLETLGWHKDLLSRNIKNCAHTGYCGMGCVIDAKQSMLVTFLPDAVRAGADIYANAWVERLVTEGRRVKSVVARVRDPETDRPTGATLTVHPRVTVLSAGGINTPAILLRSGLDANGRTGMRTFLHPAVGATGVHPDRTEPFVGSPQYVYSDEHRERGDDKMSFLIEGAPLFPSSAAGFSRVLGDENEAMLTLMPHLSLTGALLFDGFDTRDPDEGGRIALRPDRHPKIDYKWTPRLIEGLRAATRATMTIQLAGGAKQTWSSHPLYARSTGELDRVIEKAPFEPNRISVFSAHVMGGCAMGTDPRTSVVDSRTLRHHEHDDLFVVDGSIFPTSCTVNPQISIYGHASWGAEHVAAAVG